LNCKLQLLYLSTCEAKYYAVGKAAQMVLENREKLAELNFPQSYPTAINNEDNQSTLAVVNKATSGSKLRHVCKTETSICQRAHQKQRYCFSILLSYS
jgi:hypothetical protein